MDLSMKWLNDYVKADMPIKDFVAEMTMSGSKVETYYSTSEPLKNIVVGKCVSIEKHADSEKLWTCQVDIGRDAPVQIVTAAQNVYAGAFMPVVLDGGVCVDREKGGVIHIKKGKLRGAESYGMFCGFDELGLTQSDFPYASEDGVLILNEDGEFDKMKPGMPIEQAVGIDDTVVEFEITNNRPDCLSVLGLAREASATFNLPMNYTVPSFKGIDCDINKELKVSVLNTELCMRYMAAKVKNVKIGPSPRWMIERLRASGVRAINNLVDITNFVMLEYGHPMHAFDARYVTGGEIVVRNAKEGEVLTLLDEDKGEVKLSPEMLVICNANEPMALAGVMGGEHSGIQDDTTEVIFEAACFEGVNIRRTAKKVGVRTESSSRFEKKIDPVNAQNALYRALQLIELLGCGEVVNTIIDVDSSNKQPKRLKLDSKRVNEILGSDIPEEKQIEILKKLQFGYDEKTGEVIVPNVRVDIERQCDLAEEVARIYGYNNIPSTLPRLSSHAAQTPMEQLQKKLVGIMTATGSYETMTFSFISPKGYDKCRIAESEKKSVKIINPLGEDTSVMRTSMLPSMMELIARNVNNRTLGGRFFEIGREYHPGDDANVLPEEKDVLAIALYGEGEDFFTIKGIVEEICGKVGVSKPRFTAQRANESYHSGRCAELSSGDTVIGTLGEMHPAVCEGYGIGRTRVYTAVLSLEKLLLCSGGEVKYKPLPKFPASTRDLSLVCDEEISSGEIIDVITGAAKHLENVELFDVYRGEQVPEGKKSLSYKLILRKPDGTLTDEESDKITGKVLNALAAKNIVLRA